MALLFEHRPSGCVECGMSIEDKPISQSVSVSRSSRSNDVKVVQQLLNAVPAATGGPGVLLAVDGICGSKTNAAIIRYQNANLGWSDGRLDPGGPTIRSLVDFVLNSPTVPCGPVSPQKSAGGAGKPSSDVDGATVVLVALAIMRVLAPSIHLLKWRLTRSDKKMMAFIGKHFTTGSDHARESDISHLQRVLMDIDVYIANCNPFGILPVENVILYDPDPKPDFDGRTTRGGNKMSTKQVQIYRDTKTGKITKSPGQSIWLSSLFASLVTYEKHLTLLHEFAHFVGPRDGSPTIIDDYAECHQAKFLTLSRFHKLHNAESVALFLLEFCVGTKGILSMPQLTANASHFSQFPRVENREFITS